MNLEGTVASDVDGQRRLTVSPCGAPGVARQKSRGKLTCRERITLLLDEGSFHEIGSVAGFASLNEHGELLDFTASSHVGGKGMIEGRPMVCCADDFTSRGGHADGAVGAKSAYMDKLSVHLQIPMVRLMDGSSGGGSPPKVTDRSPNAKKEEEAEKESRPRATGSDPSGMPMPQHQGGDGFAVQLATVPVVTMLLGSVVGIGAAKAMVTHFSVMVRGISQLFVAGPPVVKVTMNYDITKGPGPPAAVKQPSRFPQAIGFVRHFSMGAQGA